MSRKNQSPKKPEHSAASLLEEALRRYATGNLTQAEELFDQTLELEPENADALHLKGALYYTREELAPARSLVERAILAAPDVADYHNTLGMVLAKAGRRKDAVKALRHAVGLAPDHVEAGYNLGNALWADGENSEAERCYRHVIGISPGFPPVHNALGKILVVAGKKDAAMDAFRKALELDPGLASAHFYLGSLLKEAGETVAAVRPLEHAVRHAPNHADALDSLGLVYLKLGRVDEAVTTFQAILKLDRSLIPDPSKARHHSNLGLALMHQGRLTEAEKALRRARTLSPDSPEVLNNLGLALGRLNRLEEALSVLRRALELRPDYVEAVINLGAVLGDAGKISHVLDNGRRLIALAPDRKESYEVLIPALVLACREAKESPSEGAAFLDWVKAAFAKKPWPHILDHAVKSLIPRAADQNAASVRHRCQAIAAALPPTDHESISFDAGSGACSSLPMQRVVALLFNGRSGTGFLHSLVDGHPQVSTLPGVYFQGFFGPHVWPHLTAGGADGLGQRFVALYEPLFEAASSKPAPGAANSQESDAGKAEGFTRMGDDGKASLRVDKSLFLEHLDALTGRCGKVHQGEFFRLAHAAFEKAIGRDGDHDVLFYHIHNPGPYEWANFRKHFPGARMLMTVREPLQNFESCIMTKWESGNYTFVCSKAIEMLSRFSMGEFILHDCAGICLEDIKKDRRATLRALCRWMDIEERDSLYEPTMQGLKWWGEASGATLGHQDQFDTNAIDRKVGKVLSKKDQLILGTLFYPFSRLYGYVAEDEEKFISDLEMIGPLLAEPFDFEIRFWKDASLDRDVMEQKVIFRMLRAILENRWRLLREHGTYPVMIPPLPVAGR